MEEERRSVVKKILCGIYTKLPSYFKDLFYIWGTSVIKKLSKKAKRQKIVFVNLQKAIETIDIISFPTLTPKFPASITIDPISNICDLNCPLCPAGTDKLNIEKGIMRIEVFKGILEKLPFIEYIDLFNWGEPFLNPYIFDIISYAKKRNICICVHSHFSFKKDDKFFQNIVKSGLDFLTISLDGASQETYSKYRINGNFTAVINGIKRLVNIKKKQEKNNPVITWKFIVNKYNEHEILKAKKMARQIGINFVTSKMGLSDDLPDYTIRKDIQKLKEEWLPKNKKYVRSAYKRKYKYPLYNEICTYLFNSAVINPDGTVSPCCLITNKKNTFGNLNKDSFEKIWYNDKYLYSRSLFCQKEYKGPKIYTICSRCNNFKKLKFH
ncbi:MAG: radical SAM protein [bacterium]|nr:radical SAM protein [bacterium]